MRPPPVWVQTTSSADAEQLVESAHNCTHASSAALKSGHATSQQGTQESNGPAVGVKNVAKNKQYIRRWPWSTSDRTHACGRTHAGGHSAEHASVRSLFTFHTHGMSCPHCRRTILRHHQARPVHVPRGGGAGGPGHWRRRRRRAGRCRARVPAAGPHRGAGADEAHGRGGPAGDHEVPAPAHVSASPDASQQHSDASRCRTVMLKLARPLQKPRPDLRRVQKLEG